MPICSICGHDQFVAGPAGRLSRQGFPPRCAVCGSLERHRAIRGAMDAIREPDRFADLRLIRFSSDPIVDDRWFKAAEVSIFEGDNSLDIQAIDRPDGSYDVVLCSHVIEHVADDRRAIAELARIVSARGFLVLAFPRVEAGAVTQDWGFADPVKNGHYRGYGQDFDDVLAEIVPVAVTLAIDANDPVTGDTKKFAIVSKSREWTRQMLKCVPEARLVSGRP
jgi:SAM-dependent methyltransferase